MDSKMTVLDAMVMKAQVQAEIERQLILFTSATGLEIEINASSDVTAAGAVTVGAHVVVCLPDKSPLAKDVSAG